MTWSNDRNTERRVQKLRVEAELATDTLSPTGHRVPVEATRADIARDIRRALVGDSHDTKRTERLPPASTSAVQVPASRGLTLVGKYDPTLEEPCTQGAVASLANATREARQDRARDHEAAMAAKAAKRERNREARRRRAR